MYWVFSILGANDEEWNGPNGKKQIGKVVKVFFFFFCFLYIVRFVLIWVALAQSRNLNRVDKNEPKPNLTYIREYPSSPKNRVRFGLCRVNLPRLKP